MVLAQYYNFLRLGKEGYRRIMTNIMENARYLAGALAGSSKFVMLNESQLLPIIAFRLKEESFTIFDLSDKLRQRGWIISAYTLPPNAQDLAIMRIVVREHLSRDMAEILYNDIMNACSQLKKEKIKTTQALKKGTLGHKIC